MIEIDKKKLEKAFGKRIKSNVRVLGIDTASRSGYCTAVTNGTKVKLDYGFIDTGNISDIDFKYKRLIESFDSLLNNVDKVVIEEVFLGLKFMNPKMLVMIARIGMIVYVLCEQKKIQDKYFILASQARVKLGLKGTAKKAEVHEQFLRMTGLKLEDIDIIDAIILALGGLVESETQGVI